MPTPNRPRDQSVDLGEQLFIEMADIFRKRLVMKRLFVRGGDGRPAQDLAQQRVMVGQIFQPVIVAVQAQTHDAQHENLPEAQAGPPRRLLAAADFGFQQREKLGIEFGRLEDPLQTGEDRRQFVAALEGDRNAFDGSLSQGQLHVEMSAHGP